MGRRVFLRVALRAHELLARLRIMAHALKAKRAYSTSDNKAENHY